MVATLPTNTSSHITGNRTRGVWIMQIDFATPLRLCTRETLTWNSLSWLNASFPKFDIALDGLSGSFELVNDGFAYTQFITEQSSGLVVNVRELFGEPTFDVADARLIFTGELGAGGITEDGRIAFALRRPEDRFAPRQRITSVDFNHVQPADTRYSTPNGVIEIGGV